MSDSSSRIQAAGFTHSSSFTEILAEAGCSLLVSTYQAGQLCAFGTHQESLHVDLQPYPLAMGIAVSPTRVAVGTRGMIWQLEPASRSIAASIEPAGQYDAVLLPRTAHVTGNIHGHEMAYIGDKLWVVNTLFSCLATIESSYSFVPRWKPAFVSDCHQPGDRCHLNGLAVDQKGPRLVTAMAETDAPNAWRENKHETGVLIDVASYEVISRGFAMPHSPRIHDGGIWVLDSGHGALVEVDPATGRRETVTVFPGYTRGLSFYGPLAFVGLSRIRETSVFGGLPIAENRANLKCGVGIVDLRTGRQLASFQFTSGVEEIFAVEVLPCVRCPAIRSANYGTGEIHEEEIWIAPPPSNSLEPGPVAIGP